MKTIKAHEIWQSNTKDGYKQFEVTDCNGEKLRIIVCSRTTRKCEVKNDDISRAGRAGN